MVTTVEKGCWVLMDKSLRSCLSAKSLGVVWDKSSRWLIICLPEEGELEKICKGLRCFNIEACGCNKARRSYLCNIRTTWLINVCLNITRKAVRLFPISRPSNTFPPWIGRPLDILWLVINVLRLTKPLRACSRHGLSQKSGTSSWKVRCYQVVCTEVESW